MMHTISQHRIPLSVGLLRFRATIESADELSDQTLDIVAGVIEEAFRHEVTANVFYSKQEVLGTDTSFAKCRSIFDADNVVVDIEAVLTIRKPGFERHIGLALGSALGSLGGLPSMIKQYHEMDRQRQADAERLAEMADILTAGLRGSVASVFDNPLLVAAMSGGDEDFFGRRATTFGPL